MLTTALLAAAVLAPQASTNTIEGAWTVKVQFKNGSFAAVKDLEFMLVFNRGGTMVESSNYDAAPPVPPAYGIWRKTGTRRFEAKYVFYTTKPPASFEDIKSAGGWMPGGKGILLEKINLSLDGNTYNSTFTMKMFDEKGKPGEVATAVCKGVRMRF
jgi:hypothetical protein